MNSGLARWFRYLPVAAAALLALFALYKMEAHSIALPIWGALVALSCVVPARFPDTASVVWLARIPILGFAVLTNLSRTVETVNMFDVGTMTWFGEVCAAELTLACWVQSPSGRPSARPLWLAGLVMLAASSTPDDTFIALIAPIFFLVLLISMRVWTEAGSDEAPTRPGVPWRYALAAGCVLLGGAGISAALTSQRAALTAWGMQLLGEHTPFESGSISMNSSLTSTFGQRGSMTRAMRIEGDGEFSHLRGAAFTTYSGGSWGPRRADAAQEDQLSTELEPVKPGRPIRVTRLLNNHGIVFVPLNAAGLHLSDGAPIYRVKARGGMVTIHAPAPSQYEIHLSEDADFQGPL